MLGRKYNTPFSFSLPFLKDYFWYFNKNFSMRFVVFKEKIRIVTQLSVFFGTPSGNLASATIPDKQ